MTYTPQVHRVFAWAVEAEDSSRALVVTWGEGKDLGVNYLLNVCADTGVPEPQWVAECFGDESSDDTGAEIYESWTQAAPEETDNRSAEVDEYVTKNIVTWFRDRILDEAEELVEQDGDGEHGHIAMVSAENLRLLARGLS